MGQGHHTLRSVSDPVYSDRQAAQCAVQNRSKTVNKKNKKIQK